MLQIMRDVVMLERRDHVRPRILGLTASFNNGSSKNLSQKRLKLEQTLMSRMFCPEVEEGKDKSLINVSFERMLVGMYIVAFRVNRKKLKHHKHYISENLH